MYTWEDKTILWFNKRSTEINLNDMIRGLEPSYNCFSYYSSPTEFFRNDNVVFSSAVDTTSYKNNLHKGSIPKNSVLFFTKESKFPRTKVSLSDYKRCIKIDKANYIVLNELPDVTISASSYYLFDNNNQILAIEDNDYWHYFGATVKQMLDTISKTDGTTNCVQIYHGTLKCTNNYALIEAYNNGEYKVPFILDSDLDTLINKSLPDPTIDELLAIKDMLASTDKGVVKLGGQMIAGYNVSKFPLTFRLLMLQEIKWLFSYNGGSSVVIKQLRETLGLTDVSKWGGYYNLHQVEQQGVTYSQDDINLAKQLAKEIPLVQDSDGAFADKVWCPDEYKQ